jgi:hypothetical protein
MKAQLSPLIPFYASRAPRRHRRGVVFLLLLIALLRPSRVDATPLRPNCRSQLDGIIYCVEDHGATHLLIVDLTNPHIRVQTVMANDVLDVRPPDEERERVIDMAQRYRDRNVVIAINGDYFGAGRGPEGPTIVQSQRLDTPDTIALNPSHYRRTTLVVSRYSYASIVPLLAQTQPPFVYRDVMFNAISGGPIILSDGQPAFEALACLSDRIPANSCRRDRQTAAGVDAPGKTLYLAVSTMRSTGDMASLLRDYGAETAMKLDAGGSSQLWYNGRALLDSDRGVANALLVFVEDRPRHAAELIARPIVPIIQTGKGGSLPIELRNIGYLDWTVDRHYGLRLIAGGALMDQTFLPLPNDVATAEAARLSLNIQRVSWPGVYESTWQMITPFERFGPTIALRAIVIPREANDLRGEIQALLDRAARQSGQRFEKDWPQLAARIRQMIETWVKENCEGRRPCAG